MATVFIWTQNINNKRSLSKFCKLGHYNSIIKPVCLYGAETVIINQKIDIEKNLMTVRLLGKYWAPKLLMKILIGWEVIRKYNNTQT